MLTLYYILTSMIEGTTISIHPLLVILIVEVVGMVCSYISTKKDTAQGVENWHTYHRIINKKGAKEWSKLPDNMMSPLTQKQVIIVMVILWPLVTLLYIYRKAAETVENL